MLKAGKFEWGISHQPVHESVRNCGTSCTLWSLKVLYKILPGFKPSQKFPVGLCQAPPESQTGLSLY